MSCDERSCPQRSHAGKLICYFLTCKILFSCPLLPTLKEEEILLAPVRVAVVRRRLVMPLEATQRHLFSRTTRMKDVTSQALVLREQPVCLVSTHRLVCLFGLTGVCRNPIISLQSFKTYRSKNNSNVIIVLVTEPAQMIVFNGPYDDKHTYHIKITNSSARRIG